MSNKKNSISGEYFDIANQPYEYDYFYSQPMYPSQEYPAQPMYPSYPTQPAYPTQPMYPSQPIEQPVPPVAPTPSPGVEVPGILPYEQSYIENILRLNLGKIGTFYMTYEGNQQWNAKVFKGKVEAAGRDHIIISDPETGKRFILLMVNLDYIIFDEELRYIPPQTPTPRRP